MKKLLLLGLDGASFDLMENWIEDGKLPVLREMILNGVKAPLRTTIPPQTIPAVPSLITGKNPGEIGFHEFQKKDMSVVTSKDLPSGKFWEYLSDAGMVSAIISVPFTFPPEDLNGYMVADSRFIASRDSTYTFPEELKSICADYPVGIPQRAVNKQGCFIAKIELENNKRDMQKKMEIAKRLLNVSDCDFLFLYINETDTIHHRILLEEEYVLDFYRSLELELANLMKQRFGNVIIFSDHGNEPFPEYYFSMNVWLEKEALLKRKSNISLSAIVSKLYMCTRSNQFLQRIAKKMLANTLSGKEERRKLIITVLNLDISKTKGYSPAAIGIKINRGVVTSKEEYEELRVNIMKKLSMLTDEKRGTKIIGEVHKREDYYQGKHIEGFPDILFLTNSYMPDIAFRQEVFEPISDKERLKRFGCLLQGTHITARSKEGIFIAFGKDFGKGVRLPTVRLWDIAPTVLHYFGVPIPTDIDGKVVKKVFADDSEMAKRPIKYKKMEEGRRIRQKLQRLKKR